MARATDLLSADHKIVLRQLKRLEKSLDDFENDGGESEHVIKDAGFIESVVKKHLLKEEEILFPLLGKMPGMGEGPLKMLYLEHEAFKSNNIKFQELIFLLRNKEDAASFKSDLLEKGRAIILVIREHIDKEDQILFPMAERFLGEEILLEATEKMSISIGSLEAGETFLVLDIRELRTDNVDSIVMMTFDEMPVGDGMKIIDDKNSSPIHDQLERDRAGYYVWHDEKKGPDTWVSDVRKVA